MDLVVNAGTEEEAVIELAREIKSYAEEYYDISARKLLPT